MKPEDYAIVTNESPEMAKEFIDFLVKKGYKNKSNIKTSKDIVINKVEKSFDSASINVLAAMISCGVKHLTVEVFKAEEEKQF